MVKKWEIYYIDLNPTKGSEQRGNRPALVISNDAVNDNLPIFTILPFSSVKAGATIYPTEILITGADSGLNQDSVVMLQQIRTVSQDRITSNGKISEITDSDLRRKINQALIEYFELN